MSYKNQIDVLKGTIFNPGWWREWTEFGQAQWFLRNIYLFGWWNYRYFRILTAAATAAGLGALWAGAYLGDVRMGAATAVAAVAADHLLLRWRKSYDLAWGYHTGFLWNFIQIVAGNAIPMEEYHWLVPDLTDIAVAATGFGVPWLWTSGDINTTLLIGVIVTVLHYFVNKRLNSGAKMTLKNFYNNKWVVVYDDVATGFPMPEFKYRADWERVQQGVTAGGKVPRGAANWGPFNTFPAAPPFAKPF